MAKLFGFTWRLIGVHKHGAGLFKAGVHGCYTFPERA